jgi:hypothetical protein
VNSFERYLLDSIQHSRFLTAYDVPNVVTRSASSLIFDQHSVISIGLNRAETLHVPILKTKQTTCTVGRKRAREHTSKTRSF